MIRTSLLAAIAGGGVSYPVPANRLVDIAADSRSANSGYDTSNAFQSGRRDAEPLMPDHLTAWRRLQRSRAVQGWRTTLQSPDYVSTQAQPWPALRVPDVPKRVPWLRIACVALIVINAALTVALMKGPP